MAESSTKIANMSLSKVGARSISSFNEGTAESIAVDNVYDDILDEVLAEHMWTFAQKRAVLSQLDEDPVWTEDRVSVVYALPPDFIKLNFTSDPLAIVKVENGKILSDTEDLKILYTYRNTETVKYFPKFTQALATRLAAEICFTLTESVNKTQKLFDLYEDVVLPMAVSSDSQQGSPVEAKQDEWLNSRIFGSGRFTTTPDGLNVWHPF